MPKSGRTVAARVPRGGTRRATGGSSMTIAAPRRVRSDKRDSSRTEGALSRPLMPTDPRQPEVVPFSPRDRRLMTKVGARLHRLGLRLEHARTKGREAYMIYSKRGRLPIWSISRRPDGIYQLSSRTFGVVNTADELRRVLWPEWRLPRRVRQRIPLPASPAGERIGTRGRTTPPSAARFRRHPDGEPRQDRAHEPALDQSPGRARRQEEGNRSGREGDQRIDGDADDDLDCPENQ